jgi:nitroreductase
LQTLLDLPAFGESLPIERSPETVAFLARRRSASAVTLREPAPDAAELRTLFTLATRVPDHGKLAPWRFVVLSGEAKLAFVERLEAVAATRPARDQLVAKLAKLRIPPLSVAVVSRYVRDKIPEWEQRLSAGSVCTLMLVGAQAMGYGANWITDWYAYDAEAAEVLRLGPDERVAGFIHIGTPAEPPLERVRPDVDQLVETWRP